MEKTYKRVPFTIELAKKIQSGEVEGRIVTREGKLARILCDDFYTNDVFKVVAAIRETNSEKIIRVNANGDYNTTTCSHMDLVIELLEEMPNLESVSKYIEELSQKKEATLERWYKSQEAPKCEFKPFDKVLVRGTNNSLWIPRLFDRYQESTKIYWCQDGGYYEFCIPYEGNQHLLGTTDNPE